MEHVSLVPPAVQESHVNAAILVAVLKMDVIGGVKQIRVEDDSPILFMGYPNRFCLRCFQEFFDRVLVGIKCFKIPIQRRFFVPDDEAAGLQILVGLIWGDPEVNIDGGFVGVEFDAGHAAVVFVSPKIDQFMIF